MENHLKNTLKKWNGKGKYIKNETTLIETFSYYQSENRLLTRLAEKLQAQGVEFNEIDYRQVYAILLENKTIKEWGRFHCIVKDIH